MLLSLLKSIFYVVSCAFLISCGGKDLLLDPDADRDPQSVIGGIRRLNESETLPQTQVQTLQTLCTSVKASGSYYTTAERNGTTLYYEDQFRGCNDTSVETNEAYELGIEQSFGAYRFKAIERNPPFYELPSVNEGMWKKVCDHIQEAINRNQSPKSFFRDPNPIWIGAVAAGSPRCRLGRQGMCMTLEFGSSLIEGTQADYRIGETQFYSIETASVVNRGLLLERTRSLSCPNNSVNKTQETLMRFVR